MLRVINVSDEDVEYSKQPIISKTPKDVEKNPRTNPWDPSVNDATVLAVTE